MPDLYYRNPIDGQVMALIPAGHAVFGSADGDPHADDDEKPQFTAELDEYYLGVHCVTNEQYAKFLTDTNPSADKLEEWILLDNECHVTRTEDAAYVVDDSHQ